jgi:hypothetical protein
MSKESIARILEHHGVKRPKQVIEEAERADLNLVDALAMLEQETGFPQRNVFGGDYGSSYKGRPPFFHDKVTKARVKALLAQSLNNGVGWTQLTYRPFVEQAEAMGGAHLPQYQMRVGFKVLSDLIKAHGQKDGHAGYNGTGADADAYGAKAVAIAAKWKSIIR